MLTPSTLPFKNVLVNFVSSLIYLLYNTSNPNYANPLVGILNASVSKISTHIYQLEYNFYCLQ